MSRIIVALDRADLDAFLGGDRSYVTEMAVMNELAAAFAADPEQQVEQIARAIGETGGIDWDILSNGARAKARKQARAVLASIGEGEAG